jgi:hypothetical protein
MCCDLGDVEETTKRSVCSALGCQYDKCDWRGDEHGGGNSAGTYHNENSPDYISSKVSAYSNQRDICGVVCIFSYLPLYSCQYEVKV